MKSCPLLNLTLAHFRSCFLYLLPSSSLLSASSRKKKSSILLRCQVGLILVFNSIKIDHEMVGCLDWQVNGPMPSFIKSFIHGTAFCEIDAVIWSTHLRRPPILPFLIPIIQYIQCITNRVWSKKCLLH